MCVFFLDFWNWCVAVTVHGVAGPGVLDGLAEAAHRFELNHFFKDIVQPKKRGVKRGTIRFVLTSYTIAAIF